MLKKCPTISAVIQFLATLDRGRDVRVSKSKKDGNYYVQNVKPFVNRAHDESIHEGPVHDFSTESKPE